MKRRRFLGWILAAGAAVAAPLRRVAPVRYTVALRARFYPGRVKRLSEKDTAQRAKWVG